MVEHKQSDFGDFCDAEHIGIPFLMEAFRMLLFDSLVIRRLDFWCVSALTPVMLDLLAGSFNRLEVVGVYACPEIRLALFPGIVGTRSDFRLDWDFADPTHSNDFQSMADGLAMGRILYDLLETDPVLLRIRWSLKDLSHCSLDHLLSFGRRHCHCLSSTQGVA